MPHRKLKDIVAGQELVYAAPDDSVADTVFRMQDSHVGTALILEDGELRGIFSGSNLFYRVMESGDDPNNVRIGDVMTPDPICLDCGAGGIEAVRLMRENNIRHIVVRNIGDEGYGVVSVRDFPTEEIGDFEAEFQLEERIWEEL